MSCGAGEHFKRAGDRVLLQYDPCGDSNLLTYQNCLDTLAQAIDVPSAILARYKLQCDTNYQTAMVACTAQDNMWGTAEQAIANSG